MRHGDRHGVKLSPHRCREADAKRMGSPNLRRSQDVPRRTVLAAALTAVPLDPRLKASSSARRPFLRRRRSTIWVYSNWPKDSANASFRQLKSPTLNSLVLRLLEPKLMAFDTITADRAIAQAKIAEREIRAGRYLGPLHGIPIAVKDVVLYKRSADTRWSEGIRKPYSEIRCYGRGASFTCGRSARRKAQHGGRSRRWVSPRFPGSPQSLGGEPVAGCVVQRLRCRYGCRPLLRVACY